MTCTGHRWNAGVGIENSDYRDTMSRCEREFIRKWGDWISNDQYQHPIINPKYDRGITIKNCNQELLGMLEPWADTIYVDCEYREYIDQESKRTVIDLWSKIKPYNAEKANDVLVEINAETFTQQDYIYIRQLSAILNQNKPTPGEFNLNNLKLNIIKYEEKVLS